MTPNPPARVRMRNALRKILPKSLFSLVSKVWLQTGARFYNVQSIVDRYTNEFLAHYPRVVQGGPFVGLVYVDRAVGSNYLHKLIGSYEAVLHPTIERVCKDGYDTVIDIGSAEGYYLIGLGRNLPQATLVGFEIEESGRKLAQELYDKNHLTNNLQLLGEATADNVCHYVQGKTLILCDCEGAEMDILDPGKNPIYSKVDTLIIELHDFIRPGIKEILLERFKDTHKASIIPFQMANPGDFSFLASIQDTNDLYELLRERGWQEQEWLVLERVS